MKRGKFEKRLCRLVNADDASVSPRVRSALKKFQRRAGRRDGKRELAFALASLG